MYRLFNRRGKTPRLLVLGLDCAAPQLVFKDFEADLPTLTNLRNQGTWGRLESCIPCITVPAWASMLSSCDPGILGFYGFRNRANTSYNEMQVADAASIKVKRVWDYIGDAGKESLVVNVPQTYPVKLLKGNLVSGFMTPGSENVFTYPAILKSEILKIAPQYPFDVNNFRTTEKSALLQKLIDFTEIQYRVLRYLMTTKPWDFCIHVNMGIDRLHHGFWRYYDTLHRLYEPNSLFKNAIKEYYRIVDEHLRQLIELAGDNTTILIVSDHGAKRMDGGICLNEWLWRNGWLHFKTPPPMGQVTRLEDLEIDWSKTRAWGAGGYYGRIFLNIAGREPEGIIPPQQVNTVREELAAALKTIPDVEGNVLDTQIFFPDQIYAQVNGIAPDMLIYFGDLHWRSVGTLGHNALHTLENDTGPDDANHDTHGIFILFEPGKRGEGWVDGHHLMDIAPTILHRLNIAIPPQMQGRVIKG